MSEIAKDSHRTDRARASLEERIKWEKEQINKPEAKPTAIRNIVERFQRDTGRIELPPEEGQVASLSQERVSIFDENRHSATVKSEEVIQLIKVLGKDMQGPETSLEGRVTRQK